VIEKQAELINRLGSEYEQLGEIHTDLLGAYERTRIERDRAEQNKYLYAVIGIAIGLFATSSTGR
jgi:hypothetical protein